MCVWVGVCCVAFQFLRFLLFFFFFCHAFSPHKRLLFMYGTWTVAATFDPLSMNSASVHYSRTQNFHFFINFFIKNGSYGTIYTFKNYFTTIFLVSVFNFSKNKLNPNGPIGYGSSLVSSCICLLVGCVFVFYGGN